MAESNRLFDFAFNAKSVALNHTKSNKSLLAYNQVLFPTNNPYLDSILYGGQHWNLEQNRTISYSFWQPGSESFDDQFGDICTTAYTWLDYEIAAVETALRQWSNVANISFVRTADNDASATLGFYSPTKEQLDPLGDLLGGAHPPGDPNQGIVYLPWNWGQHDNWNFGLQPGGGAFATILHEVGHALGLAHPHDDGGGSSIFPGVTLDDSTDTGDNDLNQGIWTTMSYNDGWQTRDNLSVLSEYGLQSTPMAFDIAAIQRLYGRNDNYRKGNDTYTLPISNGTLTGYSCIWDAGGVDTITTGYTTQAADIDLRAAPLVGANAGGYVSQVAGIYGGFTIANEVTIENAVGSFGNDDLIGNDTDNNLTGGGGNDTLSGGAGNDELLGMDGDDFLLGGAGKDYLQGTDRARTKEIDSYFGGAGQDFFVLGSARKSFYRGQGFAIIEDFNRREDGIVVKGITSNYQLVRGDWTGSTVRDTAIRLGGDIIGIIQDNVNIKISHNLLSL